MVRPWTLLLSLVGFQPGPRAGAVYIQACLGSLSCLVFEPLKMMVLPFRSVFYRVRSESIKKVCRFFLSSLEKRRGLTDSGKMDFLFLL